MKKANKPVCLVIAIVASLILWYYIVTVVSTEMTKTVYDIPVTFSGEEILRDQNLVITTGADQEVTLQLSGRRTVVDPLDKDNISITVDVSKIRAAGEYTRGYTIFYPNQSANVTVTRKQPDTVTIRVEELVRREIPVKTTTEGTVAEGCKIESIKPALSTITVLGTQAQVENISHALIIVDQQGLDSDITKRMEYTFVDNKGNAVDAKELEVDETSINVTVKITKFKEVPLRIEFVNGGGATESNVRCEIDPVSIEVSGSEELLNGLNKIVLENISLAAIVEEQQTLRCPIILPDGLKNESGIVTATANITLSGVVKANVQTENIDFVNVPAGYVALPLTQSLLVTVRGPAEEIGKLTSENLRVVADLASNTSGTGSYTCGSVQVYLDKATKSGVLGKYSIEYELMDEASYTAMLEEENETKR